RQGRCSGHDVRDGHPRGQQRAQQVPRTTPARLAHLIPEANMLKFLTPPASADLGAAMTPREFGAIIDEAIDQPPWRRMADIEADYVDGNQLDSQLLMKLKAIGVPPAKENIIGPAIAAVCGYEAKTRTDWRITPDGDPGGQDVA